MTAAKEAPGGSQSQAATCSMDGEKRKKEAGLCDAVVVQYLPSITH